ncbi:MAG: 50S ribosomal protein L11 methyltransferase [Lactobacillus sp.]|jgi:ribosomal protein L11 methyltransferase|nr:50S ribosomal protein L11 methyltransferase [Lactobacillus sp.]MCH3906223.1 50S ribosomal protein L11 methyltransferase [Lactobacillus sp.]MCH3990199.1 50S ribosomal protein L11 methyltransferase [Lactobacillus sp.]MCH4069087.1 50S ribosomal protein L11 methyltransferase [Lactobacillus sp.]MCI1303926.1 50S ribosomal protein L11 methyltransferase [Lactobacillus sp.]
MKLLVVTIETSHEVEAALTVFLQDQLQALGIEGRKRSDFEEAGWRHDSTVVELADIKNLPKDLELIAYFDQETDPDQIKQALQTKFAELKSYQLATGEEKITTSYIADADWRTEWQKYYHTISFSRHLAIVPKWETFEPALPGQQAIIMDPGLAFGTGGHITTQLVMLAMERCLDRPMKVADVGTGSGILAIAASKLGAESVLATDISEDSMHAARENMDLNGCQNITVKQASLLDGIDGQFDLILANILAEILLELIPQLPSHLAPGGKVIFSGIDYLQTDKIKAALKTAGLQVELIMRQKRWVGMIISRAD